MLTHLSKAAILATLLVLLSGCVVKPSVTSDYDDDCQIVTKKVELSVEQISLFNQLHCANNDECKAQFVSQIVGGALIFPISAVISGSIAIVGNTLYWLQEQGKCMTQT